MMMASLYRIFLLLLVLICHLSAISGNNGLMLPPIVGPATVSVGSTVTYEFEPGYTVYGPYWNSGSLGSVQSVWQSGGIYYVSVTWTTAGTATLRFYEDGGVTLLASKSITVNTLPTPSTTFTTTQRCGSTVVKRNTSPSESTYDWWWQNSSTGTSTTLGSADSVVLTSAATLYLRARTRVTPYSWSTAQSIGSISILSAPGTAPSGSVDGHAISNTGIPVSISVSTVSEATAYAWYLQNTNGVAIAGQTSNTYAPVVSQTTTYYVASLIGTCESASRRVVTAYIYPEPIITATNHGNVILNNPVTLEVTNGPFDSYQWYNGMGTAISGANSFRYSTNVPGNYRVQVTKYSASPFTSAFFNIGSGLNGQNMNYVTVKTVLSEGASFNDVENLPVDSVSQSTQYFDGLGRPVQTVTTQGSPLGNDIVQPVGYDDFGRESEKYLPYVSLQNDGWYKSDGKNASIQFYNSGNDAIATDAVPIANTIFEASPLNRVLKQGAPGQTWQASTEVNEDKSVKYAYEFNVANEVLMFGYDMNAYNVVMSSQTYYSANQLHVNKTIDEHGHEVVEYVDKDGKTVLKKVEYKEENGTKLYAETYYIYDDFGGLVVVLPPEAVVSIKSSLSSH